MTPSIARAASPGVVANSGLEPRAAVITGFSPDRTKFVGNIMTDNGLVEHSGVTIHAVSMPRVSDDYGQDLTICVPRYVVGDPIRVYYGRVLVSPPDGYVAGWWALDTFIPTCSW